MRVVETPVPESPVFEEIVMEAEIQEDTVLEFLEPEPIIKREFEAPKPKVTRSMQRKRLEQELAEDLDAVLDNI